MDYFRYELWRKRARDAIHKALNTLTHREREIIKLRKGIGDGYIYTLEEVGRIFNVTRERVRQIEAKAMRKLLHPVRLKRMWGSFEELLMLHCEPTQKYTTEEIAENMPQCETEEMFRRMMNRERCWHYWQKTRTPKQAHPRSERILYHSMAGADAMRQPPA